MIPVFPPQAIEFYTTITNLVNQISFQLRNFISDPLSRMAGKGMILQ